MERSIILAAGEGTRMKSKKSKVLHELLGKPMLDYVLSEAEKAGCEDNVIVVGENEEAVRERNYSAKLVRQNIGENIPYGTGYACKLAMKDIDEGDRVLVLNGDTPLIRAESLKKFLRFHEENDNRATVLTSDLKDPSGYGRIVRDENNYLSEIVEDKDASPDIKEIKEINSGIYCFDAAYLRDALDNLNVDNAQGELYLTDVIGILRKKKERVGCYKIEDEDEIRGINSKVQLAQCEGILRSRINESYMKEGVIIERPETVTIEEGARVGRDTIIKANSRIYKDTSIGEDCVIGPDTEIKNSKIADRVEVNRSVIEDSSVDSDTDIGPYAHLRPNSHLGKHVHIGNFVEVKNSNVGDHSKAGHLAYVGDCDVGKYVNIGCGVIFVNYDGIHKHRSTVKDHAFIGSNSNLVAPVTVEEKGYLAAGTTLTSKLSEGALGIGRPTYREIKGYVERKEGLERIREEKEEDK